MWRNETPHSTLARQRHAGSSGLRESKQLSEILIPLLFWLIKTRRPNNRLRSKHSSVIVFLCYGVGSNRIPQSIIWCACIAKPYGTCGDHVHRIRNSPAERTHHHDFMLYNLSVVLSGKLKIIRRPKINPDYTPDTCQMESGGGKRLLNEDETFIKYALFL